MSATAHEETGLSYRPGDPVLVRVRRRERRIEVSDEGGALDRGGGREGWRELATRLERELDVNISRQGVVSLPVVPAGPGLETIVARIAEASLTFYQELLELRM